MKYSYCIIVGASFQKIQLKITVYCKENAACNHLEQISTEQPVCLVVDYKRLLVSSCIGGFTFQPI